MNVIMTRLLIATVQLSLAEILEMNLQYLIFFSLLRNLNHVTLISATDSSKSYRRIIPVSVSEVLNLIITMPELGTVLSLHVPLASAGKFHSQIIKKMKKQLNF